jgi:hypothetical protein
MAGLPRGRRRPRCTDKSTPSTSTSMRTRQAPIRRHGAREVTGCRKRLRAHRRARWVYGIRRFPRFGYRGEMTGGMGHSRQRQGLDKGVGSEALTGDERRGEQSSGGVAVSSSSRCSCARRRVRIVGGCCSRGESKREAVDGGAHRRGALDEDGAEVKWTTASGEVERWSNGLFQLERRGDKVGLDDTRGLRSGGSVVVRWRAAAQLSRARIASVQRPIKRCWTLTSGPSAILNFQ